MKYVPLALKSLENALVSEFDFSFCKQFSDKTYRVYEMPGFRRRRYYVVVEGVESPSHCGLMAYCYSTASGNFDRDYIPVNTPDEASDRDVAAFDISLLENRTGIAWSFYNDNLDRRYDSVFKGGEDQILERLDLVVKTIKRIVKGSLLPYLQSLESSSS